MPKLPKDAIVEAKLDSAADALDEALTVAQKRAMFEQPGLVTYAIVEVRATAYTGHADGTGKAPTVKLRITGAEVAMDENEVATLAEAQRAMFRRRRMDGTLDELGQGPRDPGSILRGDFAGYPSEDEYRRHEEKKAARAREVERAANLR
jgi:hypothetical protein